MWKRILLGLVVLVAVLAGFIAMQPAEFQVSRSAAFAAPPDAVFAQVNELKRWNGWSPWAKKDPQMKQSYEGPSAGTGASTSWAGNSEVGEGRMTIVESRPNERVRFKLEFFEPFAATNSAVFEFKPEGQGTRVTWTMNGRNNFVGKAMCLVFDMDKMVGGDFEAGLASIKGIVENR